MRWYTGILLFILSGVSEVKAGRFIEDSLNRKNGFSILTSVKPLVKWVSKKDSSENFFYSNVQFELQYRYKRHSLGIGFSGSHSKSGNPVNAFPNEIEKTKYAFAPIYSYMIHSKNRWKCFVGASYIYNYDASVNTFKSSIEVITKSYTVKEEGGSLFFRVNYRLNKHFSVELETAFYSTRSSIDLVEDYPLTPSMSVYKTSYKDSQTYSVPSNLFVRYNF